MLTYTLESCENFDKEHIIDANEAYELALFPLSTVLFPTTSIPLRIFEPRYVDLISRCMRDDKGFGVVALASGAEIGPPGQTHTLGTSARIVDFDQGPDGLLNVVIVGEERFRILQTKTQSDNLLLGQVIELARVPQFPIPEEFQELSELFDEISSKVEITRPGGPPPSSAAELAYNLAQYLPLPIPTKMVVLEIDNALELLQFISTEIRNLQRQGQ
ncbi:MAG TPA: peptidase S16 [Gammaproteobacteria bacterium]|nr:peptidase S16 [Gammaproteobacteria bacterium]